MNLCQQDLCNIHSDSSVPPRKHTVSYFVHILGLSSKRIFLYRAPAPHKTTRIVFPIHAKSIQIDRFSIYSIS